MATQYTDILKLAKPTAGELDGTWGDVVNNNITSMIEEAIAGRAVVNTWTTNSHTLTEADGLTSEARCAMLEIDDDGSGNPTASATVICPSKTKTYIVNNSCGQTATIKTSAGTGVAVPDGTTMLVFCDGTNVVQGMNNFNTLYIDGVEVTASAAELNAFSGITASAAELNTLDGITATTSELNLLDGVTATTAEINYLDGVTSAIQTQLDGKADSGDVTPSEWGTITGTLSDQTDLQSELDNKEDTLTGAATTIASSDLTASRALAADASGKVAVSAVTATELGYLSGVTSAIQTQLDGKADSGSGGGTWGSITGTLSDQTDLQSELDSKATEDGTPSFTTVSIGSWTLSESGGKLVFNNGANRFSIDATGNIVADNDITAYGSP